MADPKPRPRFQFGSKPKDMSKLMYTGTNNVAKKPSITLSKAPTIASSNHSLPTKYGKNGLPKPNGVHRKSLTPSHSRQSSTEPRDNARKGKGTRPSRSSPVVTTPRFDSDSDEENHLETPRKKVKLDDTDKTRRIRDAGSFSEDSAPYSIIHAADIANNQVQEHGRYKFGEFFSALQEDEDECPTIELEYPCGNMKERYQLVRPTDPTDYRPLSEIHDNMIKVKEFYLDSEGADKIQDDAEFGEGLAWDLQKYAKDSARAGSQQRFIDVVQKYNDLLTAKRKSGVISAKLDKMPSPIKLDLVEHIVKSQIYARTVSAHVETVRDYKPFSDNVYGELLPKFLSQIFKETHLSSNQVFVDLGSGVGNCVLQAALEIGCESWGCEVMDNPATLAEASAREFPPRCRMWGIKPGKIRLIHDDFTTNQDIRKALARASVVLVNNQAFTPELNDSLKHMFLDLKEGCQIVSLKYFRDPAHRVKDSNINDVINCLSVTEKDRFSQMVSWSDDPGKWYIQKKDSTELRTVRQAIERSKSAD